MNRETEILLKRARALPIPQQRELVAELLRFLGSGPPDRGEVNERIGIYDAGQWTLAQESQERGSSKAWVSMEEFRSRLGVAPIGGNPVLEMREEERF